MKINLNMISSLGIVAFKKDHGIYLCCLDLEKGAQAFRRFEAALYFVEKGEF